MSCNHCNIKFNFFNKELGCANCGLSLCGNCLKQKCQIPGKGLEKVCRPCYSKLINGAPKSDDNNYSPPDRFLKRLEKPPITIYKSVLKSTDQQLAERLEKLKDKPKITDEELRQRLAKLKGQTNITTNNEVFVATDTRSEQEKVDALLEQLSSEPQLSQTSTLEQSDLEQAELPWCVLCNDDAKFRCYDCDGDLYCNNCNIEAHKDWGETDHKVVPYNKTQSD